MLSRFGIMLEPNLALYHPLLPLPRLSPSSATLVSSLKQPKLAFLPGPQLPICLLPGWGGFSVHPHSCLFLSCRSWLKSRCLQEASLDHLKSVLLTPDQPLTSLVPPFIYLK